MKIGIDKIGFATSQYMLNMDDLAESRQVDPEKYSKGLLLRTLSITPVNDDIDVKLLIPYMLLVTIITPRNSYNTNLYGNITFFFN